jgi:hypothetical protein
VGSIEPRLIIILRLSHNLNPIHDPDHASHTSDTLDCDLALVPCRHETFNRHSAMLNVDVQCLMLPVTSLVKSPHNVVMQGFRGLAKRTSVGFHGNGSLFIDE